MRNNNFVPPTPQQHIELPSALEQIEYTRVPERVDGFEVSEVVVIAITVVGLLGGMYLQMATELGFWWVVGLPASFVTVLFGLYLCGVFGIPHEYMRNKTERRRIDAAADVAEEYIAMQREMYVTERYRLAASAVPQELANRLGTLEKRLLDGSLATPIQIESSNFVPVHEQEHVVEAIRWVSSLYMPSGEIDERKVNVSGGGILKVPCIGSKRGPGSSAAREYLRDMKILVQRGNNDCLNIRDYPTRDRIEYINAPSPGGGGGGW